MSQPTELCLYPHSSAMPYWNIQQTYDCLLPTVRLITASHPPAHSNEVIVARKQWTVITSHACLMCTLSSLCQPMASHTHGSLGSFLQASAGRYVSNYKPDAGLSTLCRPAQSPGFMVPRSRLPPRNLLRTHFLYLKLRKTWLPAYAKQCCVLQGLKKSICALQSFQILHYLYSCGL